MRDVPPKPSIIGQMTPFGRWVKRVHEVVFGPEGKLRDVPGQIEWRYTPQGVYARVKLPPGSSSSPAPSSDYAGVYVPGQIYDALQWVVVQSGAASGAYISTADNNSNAPITGINWVQFSALPQWF